MRSIDTPPPEPLASRDGDADDLLFLLRRLSEGPGGVAFVYEALDHVASRFGLSDAAVVVADAAAGPQAFRLGRRAIAADGPAALARLEPGLWTVPDAVPPAVRDGVASLCRLAVSLHLADRTSRHDRTTGLLDAEAFGEVLGEAAAQCSRYGWAFVLVVADLDGGGDGAGGAAGERSRRAVGRALGHVRRAGDVAGRLGPTRVGALLRDASPADVGAFVQRLGAQLPDGADPPAVGAAAAPADSVEPDALLRLAEARLAEARPPSAVGGR